MTEHSILAPSSAARRVACPGSRALEAAYPELEESDEAKQGHAAHWAAAQFVRSNRVCAGEMAPNGETITNEMWEAVWVYLAEIGGTADILNLHIEEQIPIHSIHPLCFGTPDAWCFNKDHLYIWDFKYGHAYVDVFENWQLIAYVAGILEAHVPAEGVSKVTFCIVQPRSFHRDGPVRKWTIDIGSLCEYFSRLVRAEYAAMEPDAKCTPSPECKNCNGRHACEALQHSALSALDESKRNTPHELTPAQLGSELRYLNQAAERLDARITGLSEQALATIKRGDRVPGFRVEPTASRERWAKTVDEVVVLGQMFGTNLKKPVELITPKQAVKAGVPEEIIKQYSETPSGALKLVAEKASVVRKIFKKD